VPSIKPEPFGLVVIEAMAAGIPVIGSGEGGPSEIIEDGYTGILFEPRNPKALAAAINRMLDDETLRNTLSSNALARVNSHFTIKKYNEDLFCAIENS
jgi:glycosyltransferase involved in cell wall biosynthesis